MKTYIFLANGFEETEALCPWDLLLRAGVPVKLVSINDTREVTGTHGLVVRADMTAAELPAPSGGMCVVLPGGMPGASNLEADGTVAEYLDHAVRHGHAAAICAAPYVLGVRGFLKGRRATCFPGFEDKLRGAVVTGEKVTTDGNITTARGMGAAYEFGAELIRVICGYDAAHKVVASAQNDIL